MATNKKASNEVPLEKSNKRILMLGIIFSVITLIVTGVTFYLRGKLEVQNIEDLEVEEEIAEDVKLEKSVVEEETGLKREEISIQVLNGSGSAGLAGETAQKFEELGYEDVGTGNADSAETTQLFISDEYTPDDFVTLIEDVEELLGVKKISGAKELDTTAQIILGVE